MPAIPVRGWLPPSLALVVLGLLLGVPPAHGEEVVHVVVTEGAADTGVVEVGPAAQVSPPDTIRWTVLNGTNTASRLALSVVGLDVGDDGALVAGAPTDLVMETSELRLDPGEAALVRVQRRAVADRLADGLALAVRTSDDADPLLAVVVTGRQAPTELEADLDRDDGRLRGRVALGTRRAVLVDLRTRLVTWPGRVVGERTVRDVVVLPPGREVQLDLAGTALVGPVDLEVVAGSGPDAIRSADRVWIVNRTAVRSTGTVVLALTVLAVLVGVRRLRRTRRATDGAR